MNKVCTKSTNPQACGLLVRRRAVAFLVAFVLLALHTTGEAFHYLSHLSPVSPAAAQMTRAAQTGSSRENLQMPKAFKTHADHCALCSLNALFATLRPPTSPLSSSPTLALTASQIHWFVFTASRRVAGDLCLRGPPSA